jgi:hypothetical protein
VTFKNIDYKMIVVLGDSDFRNMFAESGERMSASVGKQITFYMATSNESIKLQLEQEREDMPEIIIIGTPVNEIVQKVARNKNKGRDETIRSVLEEHNKIISDSAKTKENCIHLVVPPFLRTDPEWIQDRIRLGAFYVKDFIARGGPWNVVLASTVDIVKEDLVDDDVHLNEAGKEKLYKSLEKDVLKCLENMGENMEGRNWASLIGEGNEPPTPSTLRKRTREVEEEEDEDMEEEGGPKKARLDTVLDKLDILVKEMRQDRNETKTNIDGLIKKVEEKSKAVEEIKQTVDSLKESQTKDVEITAEVREDLDSLENENLKTVVVIRKLKTSETVPQDRIALRTFIQAKARALVEKMTTKEAASNVKYAAPLFAVLDSSKKDNAPGFIPPFKIGFGSKDVAVNFRDTAVKKSKEEGSEYKGAYFTFFQSPGTRVRCILMWSVADSLKSETKDVWVNQFSPKPTMQIKENGKTRSLTFVKTMLEFKDKIGKKALDEAKKLAQKHFAGKLEKTFIAIKD